MWQLISHALPVGTRLFGDNANTPCPRCGHHTEDMEHMALKCGYAKKARKATFKEWFVRTGNSKGYHNMGTKEAIFDIDVSDARGMAWATLNAILIHNIWKDRCNHTYRQEESLPVISLVNKVWAEFEATILARTKEINNKIKWWSDRAYVNLVPSKVASQHQTELHAHGSTLAALLPDWLSPVNFSELASYIRSSWATRVETEDFLLLEQSPAKFPRMDHKWKLNSHPKPGMGALVTLSDSEAESETASLV